MQPLYFLKFRVCVAVQFAFVRSVVAFRQGVKHCVLYACKNADSARSARIILALIVRHDLSIRIFSQNTEPFPIKFPETTLTQGYSFTGSDLIFYIRFNTISIRVFPSRLYPHETYRSPS